MKTNIIILILLCFAFSNCKNESKAESSIAASSLNLKLNGSEKWIANPETHEGVLKMDSIISAFKDEEKNDFTLLGETLSKQTSYIIKNCSMKGESHDQLHVVLVPMLDAISALKESKNNAESNKILTELQVYIDAYFNYFKL